MKKTFISAIVCILLLSGCASYQRIGGLTSISTRNIDPNSQYVELKRYVEATSDGQVFFEENGIKEKQKYSQLNSEGGEKLNTAIEYAVRSVPGGEFMKNVSIWVIEGGGTVKVIGDVWGNPLSEITMPVKSGPLQPGDKVFWYAGRKGKITGIIQDMDTVFAHVKAEDGKIYKIEIADLARE